MTKLTAPESKGISDEVCLTYLLRKNFLKTTSGDRLQNDYTESVQKNASPTNSDKKIIYILKESNSKMRQEVNVPGLMRQLEKYNSTRLGFSFLRRDGYGTPCRSAILSKSEA